MLILRLVFPDLDFYFFFSLYYYLNTWQMFTALATSIGTTTTRDIEEKGDLHPSEATEEEGLRIMTIMTALVALGECFPMNHLSSSS